MGALQYEKELLEEIRKFPEEQVKEVLDFAAFLRQKIQRERDQQSLTNIHRGFSNKGTHPSKVRIVPE